MSPQLLARILMRSCQCTGARKSGDFRKTKEFGLRTLKRFVAGVWLVILCNGFGAWAASNVACWGDAFTSGSDGTNWPSILASLNGVTAYNGGVPNDTSVQVADRGADPTNAAYGGWATIVWAGYNDFLLPGGWQANTIITNVNRIMAARSPSRLLVLGLVNAEGDGVGTTHYQAITNVNAGLAQAFGTNFFDIRSYLVSQYNPNSSQDVADFANDIPPTSLRVDGLHWNAAGHQAIAAELSKLLTSAVAPPPPPPPPPSPPPLAGSAHFVSPSGSDGAAGTIDAPWQTISYGVSHVSPGDTLYLRQGNYHESFTVGINGITVSGYPGESAVIDGQINIPTSSYWPLVYVQSDNVTLTNLSVINSWYVGVILSGLADRATHLTVNSNMENGILVSGNYDIVDNCSVQWNARSHQFYTFNIAGRTTWAGGINVARCPGNATITNNTVWNTWGEGMSTYESTNNLFRGNVSYDNQVCLYISDTTDDTIDGNIFYCSPNNVVKTAMGSDNQPSILLGDEKFNPASARNTFINNLVMGGDICFYNTLAANNYVVVENNTFVNAFGNVANVQVNGDGPGSTFINNIVEQDNGLPCIYINYSDWAVHNNNLWNKTPSASAAGTGDVVANPQLAKTGGIGAGQLSGNWFRIAAGSPAARAGAPLANVVDDFFGAPRTNPLDIGGCAVHALNPPSNLRIIAAGP